MQKPIIFTKEGLEKMEKEYEDLLKERPHAVEELAKARAMGDLSENGYYKASRMKLSSVDHRLSQLRHIIQHAMVKTAQFSDFVDVGVTVTISDGTSDRTYQLVGGYESNPSEGKISIHSPLGRSLTGKKLGETAIFESPRGKKEYLIKEIKI